MKKFILAGLFILIISIIGFGQTTDDDIDLMERAKMVAEIRKLRAETAQKDIQITALKDKVKDMTSINDLQNERIKDLKESIAQFKTAGSIDIKIENMYKTQLADYKTETLRLRDENDKLRKSRDRRSLIFGIAGLIGGALLY